MIFPHPLEIRTKRRRIIIAVAAIIIHQRFGDMLRSAQGATLQWPILNRMARELFESVEARA